MMEFLGARVQLNPRPARQFRAALEVAMLGHCPGRVRISRLLQHPDTLNEIRQLGYHQRIETLTETGDDPLTHLPIPLHSAAEFNDIFPDARTASSRYRSVLAGDRAWLPRAVEDFFSNGGEKLWIIAVPEEAGIDGFLPDEKVPLHNTEELRGISILLILNRVGLFAMPDLERIQVPAHLPDIPRKRLLNPAPQFIPCSTNLDDDHRERRTSAEMVNSSEPVPTLTVLQKLLPLLEKHRSDMQCLLTLPLEYSQTLDSPNINRNELQAIESAASKTGGHRLRQVQFLFPYLRSARRQLITPVGLMAGIAAGTARNKGIWRSIAGLPMVTDGRPYPKMELAQAAALRDKPGIGVLHLRNGQVVLDDERLVVPALYKEDYVAGDCSDRIDGFRSGEVARFMGYLKRELQALGENLIFNIGADDPRPRLTLEKFFLNLYRAGALRGSLPEKAFRIRQLKSRENQIAFEIEVAPAFPIDRLVLTFVNRDTEWVTEVKHG